MIGETIKKIRKNKKLKSKEIAESIGVSPSTYSKWENDTRDIPSDYIPKVAEALNVSVDTLFGLEDTDVVRSYKNRHSKEVTYEIMEYLINKWDGDVDSAVQLFACYAALPVELRKEVATFCMVYFTESIDLANKELVEFINVERCREIVERLKDEKR